MAFTLLADADVIGPVEDIVRAMREPYWLDYWQFLGIHLTYFRDVGLDPADPDSVVWRTCQERQILLITGNRNGKGDDSLESTIRLEGTPTSWPVFTIGSVDRLRSDREYASRLVSRLYEYLDNIESVLGTGRLYLP